MRMLEGVDVGRNRLWKKTMEEEDVGRITYWKKTLCDYVARRLSGRR